MSEPVSHSPTRPPGRTRSEPDASDGSGWPVLETVAVFGIVAVVQLVTGIAGAAGGLFVLAPPLTRDPWTVVTSVYAHENLGHLLSNAVALGVFGWPVARATTRWRFHGFFLATGALAGISQIVVTDIVLSVTGDGVAVPGVLGASGAVFALLGYLLAGNRLTTGLAARVDVPTWFAAAIFLGLAAGVTWATASPRAALVAHFTGLLLGLVAGRAGLLDPG